MKRMTWWQPRPRVRVVGAALFTLTVGLCAASLSLMELVFHKLVRLAAALVIILASGPTGRAAYAAHDHDVPVAHAIGQHADHHHHRHGGIPTILHCDEAWCDQEPGGTQNHEHIVFSMSPAIAPDIASLILTERSEARAIPLGASLLLDGPSYPLLRPPRAST
jgi:hypothetical protein